MLAGSFRVCCVLFMVHSCVVKILCLPFESTGILSEMSAQAPGSTSALPFSCVGSFGSSTGSTFNFSKLTAASSGFSLSSGVSLPSGLTAFSTIGLASAPNQMTH